MNSIQDHEFTTLQKFKFKQVTHNKCNTRKSLDVFRQLFNSVLGPIWYPKRTLPFEEPQQVSFAVKICT